MLEAFAKNGADVNFQDNNGQTPMHYAAASGNYSIICQLVSNNANRLTI